MRVLLSEDPLLIPPFSLKLSKQWIENFDMIFFLVLVSNIFFWIREITKLLQFCQLYWRNCHRLLFWWNHFSQCDGSRVFLIQSSRLNLFVEIGPKFTFASASWKLLSGFYVLFHSTLHIMRIRENAFMFRRISRVN